MISKKLVIYLDFVEIFVDTVRLTREKKNIKALGTKLLKTSLNLMVVAPDSVVKKCALWKTYAMEGGDIEKTVKAFADVVIEMRKDIVGKTECDINDVLDTFLQG